MSANDIRWGRRGGHEVDADRVIGNGRCAHCQEHNPPDRWLYCSDSYSEASRAAKRGRKKAT